MKLFIFNFFEDENLINGFLDSAAIAHQEQPKTREFFYWKFRDNPFGRSILSCALHDNKIVGCVALGMQDFIHNGKVIKAAISFETFIHPDFQGKGLFKQLIDLAESEASNRDIEFLLNFPNSKSFSGFIKNDWKELNCSEYWLKGNNYLKLLSNIKDLKKTFVPNAGGINEFTKYKNHYFEFINSMNCFKLLINNDYLDWRFFSYPNAQYEIVNNDDLFSIARVGYRGKLKEIQVLLVEKKSERKLNISSVIKEFKKQIKYDFVSFPISNSNTLKKQLKKHLFLKVPNHTNVTFKMLNPKSNYELDKIELSAINYHTY